MDSVRNNTCYAKAEVTFPGKSINKTCAVPDVKNPAIDIFEAEQEIRSFVLRYDGMRYAYQLMEQYRQKAIEALNLFPENKYKDSLIALLDYAIKRVH